MNMKEIRSKAEELGIKLKGACVKKTFAIRAIQSAEGFEECYATGKYDDCGQETCCFRPDCIKAGIEA